MSILLKTGLPLEAIHRRVTQELDVNCWCRPVSGGGSLRGGRGGDAGMRYPLVMQDTNRIQISHKQGVGTVSCFGCGNKPSHLASPLQENFQMWRTFRVLGAGLITLLAGTTAFSQQEPSAAKSGQAERQRTQEQAPSDRALRGIAREVRHELVMLPYYGVFDNFSFRVDGSTVTLLGQVTRPTLKSSAENVVRDIEGVEIVVNNIEVLPLSPNGDRIRLAAYRAIYGHSALNRYSIQAVPPIHIIVKNGKIALEGVVASEADKNIANIQARSVPGAFNVTNNLRVESGDE